MSADIIDDANDLAEKHLAEYVTRARGKPKRQHLPVACLNFCGTPPQPGALYCSDECRQDREARNTILRKQVAR